MSQKIGGIIQLAMGGEGLRVQGGFEITMGGIKRTAVWGQDGVYHGYTEEVGPAMIDGKLIVAKDTDVNKIVELVDGIITLTLSPTFIFRLSDALYTGDKKIVTTDGTLSVQWSGTGKYAKL